MLDIMRKHASSWLIKLILGAIIISFIFFFGYSSFRKGGSDSRVGAEGGVALKVNDMAVSMSEFKFFFDRNFDRIKSQFQGAEIPEFARKLAESTTIQQLIGREIMLQQADSLGLVITDEELADAIRDGQAAQSGGEFDPISYRHEFLPYFRQRYNMDYERFVRQDMRMGALQQLFSGVDSSPQASEALPPEEGLFTFEAVVLVPEELVKSKAAGSEEDARNFADRLARAAAGEWKKMLSDAKLSSEKIGPIRVSERKKLLGGMGSFEQHREIFSLTKDKPVAGPYEIDGKLVVVRFLERGPSVSDPSASPSRAVFFDEWMGKLMANAKVHNYMAEDQE